MPGTPAAAAAARAFGRSAGSSTCSSFAGFQRDRAFDRVFQLAHVAGPLVAAQAHPANAAFTRRMLLPGRAAHTFSGNGLPAAECLRGVRAREAPGWESRSGGSTRSSRKAFSATALSRSRLVAAITRTSMGISSVPPTGRTVRSCSTRSSLTCMASVISLISSRKIVPPSATSNKPALVLIGSGESAFYVTEEFALQQRLGKCAAVDGDEGFGGARRTNVNRARHQFFTGAALAVDQHRAGRRSHGPNGLLQLLHGAGLAPMMLSRELRVAASRRRAKFCLLRASFLHRTVDGQLDFVHQAGTLADVVGGAAGFYGLHRRLVVIDRRNQDDGGVGRDLVRVAQALRCRRCSAS